MYFECKQTYKQTNKQQISTLREHFLNRYEITDVLRSDHFLIIQQKSRDSHSQNVYDKD